MDINYFRIKDIAASQNVTIRQLAKLTGMTETGFKISIDNGNFAIKNVILICQKLNITPNQFFGFESDATVTINQSGMQNSQTNNLSSVSVLERQLEIKDKQIERLMNLLNK